MKFQPTTNMDYEMQPRKKGSQNVNYEQKSTTGRPIRPESPLKKHGCTDIICTVLMFLFIGLLIFVSVYAYVYGDPVKLILPHDSTGLTCGSDKEVVDKKYLFYFDLTRCISVATLTSITGCPTRQVCVEKCPDKYAYRNIPGQQAVIDPFCDPTDKTVCPDYLVKSKPVLNRCVPEIIVDTVQEATTVIEAYDNITNQTFPIKVLDQNGVLTDLTIGTLKKAGEYVKKIIELKSFAELVLEDFTKSYQFIIVALVIGGLCAFIWLVLMRFFVKPIVYLSILLSLLALLVAAGYCFYQYILLLNSKETNDFKLDFDKLFNISYLKGVKETWLALGIIIGVIFLIVFLIIFFLRKRIKFAAEILKETSKAIVHFPTALVWPILPLILQIAVAFYCISIAVYLASSGVRLYQVVDLESFNSTFRDIKYDVGDYCIPDDFYRQKEQYPDLYENLECFFFRFGYDTKLFVNVGSDEVNKYYTKGIEFINDYQWLPQLFVLFMFFWLFAFLQGLNQMTISGSFGSWYFTRYENIDPSMSNKLPFFTVLGSFGRSIFFHFGTIAFGSLIIAIIKTLRVLLDYVAKKLKKSEDVASKIVGFLLCCCKCCLACFERFVKFINRYAFIITAIYSYNFIRAALMAVKLIASNPLRTLLTNKITNFLLFLSTLIITASIGVLSFYFFSNKLPLSSVSPDLNYFFLPIIAIIIGVFLICKLFFDVFATGVDTILISVLIDCEENDGTQQKPYFMSKSLRKLVKK